MKITPLRGQCLVEILPNEPHAGILLPDNAEIKGYAGKLPPQKGIVRRLGPWPQKKGGRCVLPEFVPGDTVILSQYAGVKMQRHIGLNYRMVRVEDVIAKVV